MQPMRRTYLFFLACVVPSCGGGGGGGGALPSPLPAIGLSGSALMFSCAEGGADPADQTIVLSNTGEAGSTLLWTATSNQPWLTVSPAIGNIGTADITTLTIHVNARHQLEGWVGATSTAGAPSPRWVHSMAWAGSQMVVWGGSTSVAPSDVNTGGRYIVDTNAWIGTTSLVLAPSARRYSSAVWTGSSVIFWGGTGAGGWNTGYFYTPDVWTSETTTVGAPGPREAHTAVWTGSQMIIWGGWDGTLLNTGFKYSPSTNSWVGATSTMGAIPRQEHVAVWTGSRMILWGGRNGVDASSSLNTGQLYDPATDMWTGSTPTAGAPSPATAPAAVWTGREMIVWGGHNGATWLDTGARYNPLMNEWVAALPTAGAPSARYRHRAVWTGSRMIVWGGQDEDGMTNTGGIYRPPIPAIGPHTAMITIDAPGVSAKFITVSLTVSP